MADDRYRQDYHSHSRPEDHQSQESARGQPQRAPQGPSHQHPYPPPPGEGEQRSNMAAPMSAATLPPMHEGQPPANYGGLPSLPPPGSNAYPTDPRFTSPHQATNGYPPPPGSGHMGSYLPPPNHYDPRAAGYRPQDPYAGGRQPPHYPSEQYQQQQSEYGYRQPPGQPMGAYPPPPPPNGYSYGVPPQHHPGYAPEYPQTQGPPIPQAAPRQRTSIACKYCRKRKIRCSGYQSAPGGKCQNCARMNQECVFQPVSSSSSTAFIPVSAVPGGVPPGTPLFGAYGQPLAPQPHNYPPGSQPPPPPGSYYHQGPHPQQQQQPTPPHHAQQQQSGQATHSPVESSYSYTSRGEESSQTSRRRRRSSEDQDEARLPPPRVGATGDEPRRRSPAEHSNTSSPSVGAFPPQARHSPRSSTLSFGSNANPNGPLPGMNEGRSPVVQNGSAGSMASPYGQSNGQQTTPQPGRVASPAGAQQSSSVMSLSNLVEKNDIDRGMINRLNRPREPKS